MAEGWQPRPLLDPASQCRLPPAPAVGRALLGPASQCRLPPTPAVGLAMLQVRTSGRRGRATDLAVAPAREPFVHPWGCYLTAVVAELGFLVAAAAWAGRGRLAVASADSEGKASDGRFVLYDTAKAVCILFVILGHWTFINLHGWGVDFNTWLKGGERGVTVVLNVTTSFSMPLFCILSGVVCQGPPTTKRVCNYLQYLVVPSVLWIGAFHKVICGMLTNQPFPEWDLTALVADEWYLSSLVIWRGVAFLFFHRLHPLVLFLLAQAVSCIGGYFHFGGVFGERAWYWQFLQGDATLGFLPYFVLGYILPLTTILRLVPEPSRLVRLAALLGVVLWATLVQPAAQPGGDPHFSFHDQWEASVVESQWGFRLYWTARLAQWGVDVLPSLVFLVLVLPREETFMTWMGPHTLYPYLFHHVFLTWHDKVLQQYPPPIVESAAGHVLVLAFHVVLSYLATALFCSSGWRRPFDWLLKPQWLDPLVQTVQASLAPQKAAEAPLSGGC